MRPVLVDEATVEPIDPRTLYAGPGPAFPAAEEVRRVRFSEYYERRGARPSSRSDERSRRTEPSS